ncbi:MAG: CocE/NonD family hydrolase [Deltaproteobacteria bacterium]|nr:CocE/NonD family hydrolase [Deltaproteobacteria bacterium]
MKIEYLWNVTVLFLLLATFGCGDDEQQGTRPSDEASGGEEIAPGSGGATTSGGSSGYSGSSGQNADAALDAAAGTEAGIADSGREAGSAGSDAAGANADGGAQRDTATQPVTLPDGAISTPGQYSGLSEEIYNGYELSSEYVTVRDGTRLAMDLYRPKGASGQVVIDKLPVLFMHTPYNRRTFGTGLSGEVYPGAAARLINYGYVVAIADFRGVYASYGTNQGYNRGEWVDAASQDAYDLIEWLAQQPWSSGKVGMWGCSATGGSQMQAATTAPPSLKAIFPMSCEYDVLPFGVPGCMAPVTGPTSAPPTPSSSAMRDPFAQAVDDDPLGVQLREAVASHAFNIENAGYVPFRDSVAENIPEQWWIKSSPSTYLETINNSKIAVYAAANWDEAATKYGAFFTVNNITNPTKLIVGPAGHCAWFTVETQTGFDISVEERRFFDYWLKGIENNVMAEPKVYYYTYNEPAGREWRGATEWPLAEEKRTPYYLGEGSLGVNAPTDAAGNDEFRVVYIGTDVLAKGLSYETAALQEDIRITGHPVVDLWVSSTATDGDFIATLQDVAPNNIATSYNMHGRLRASMRKEEDPPYNNLGLPWHPCREADAQPLVPGEPTRLRFDMLPISIVFKAGHRIRLVLSFADTPTPVITPAPTVTIYRDATHQSSVTLPIIDS